MSRIWIGAIRPTARLPWQGRTGKTTGRQPITRPCRGHRRAGVNRGNSAILQTYGGESITLDTTTGTPTADDLKALGNADQRRHLDDHDVCGGHLSCADGIRRCPDRSSAAIGTEIRPRSSASSASVRQGCSTYSKPPNTIEFADRELPLHRRSRHRLHQSEIAGW